jgi:hypothetical protein
MLFDSGLRNAFAFSNDFILNCKRVISQSRIKNNYFIQIIDFNKPTRHQTRQYVMPSALPMPVPVAKRILMKDVYQAMKEG